MLQSVRERGINQGGLFPENMSRLGLTCLSYDTSGWSSGWSLWLAFPQQPDYQFSEDSQAFVELFSPKTWLRYCLVQIEEGANLTRLTGSILPTTRQAIKMEHFSSFFFFWKSYKLGPNLRNETVHIWCVTKAVTNSAWSQMPAGFMFHNDIFQMWNVHPNTLCCWIANCASCENIVGFVIWGLGDVCVAHTSRKAHVYKQSYNYISFSCCSTHGKQLKVNLNIWWSPPVTESWSSSPTKSWVLVLFALRHPHTT